MKSTSQFFGVLLATAALVTTTLRAATPDAPAATNSASKVSDLFPDPVIARGNGFEIKRSQLDDAISAARGNAAAQGMQVTAADMPTITKNSLDHLLQVRLLMAKATDAEKATGRKESDDRFLLISKRAANAESLA